MQRIIILMALLAMLGCQAQDRMVESSAFDLMLKGLVPDEAPLLGVQAAQEISSAQYLDARAYEEYEVSHIPGAQWVGYDDFEASRVEGLDPNRPVIVYCSVGYRSGKIAEQLAELGFEEAYNLYGGIFEWSNQGFSLVNAEETPTEEVHGFSPAWGIWVTQGVVVYE